MDTERPIYAHSLPDADREHWETLPQHAAAVADFARRFADGFGAGAWGELLGLWHDLGKRSAAFQGYITATGDPNAAEEEQKAPGRVDHSTFGARHAVRSLPGLAGQLLAFCIAGHHGRMPDATTTEEEGYRSTLVGRLDEKVCSIPPVALPADFPPPPLLRFPFPPPSEAGDVGFAVAFFGRMLFSALVDADRTATEAFCDPPAAAERARAKPTLDHLRPALDAFLSQKQADAPPTAVNRIRADVLAACVAKAALPPGFFSLNVPTGGGKTFASLAFALHHANYHRGSADVRGLRRVVVAIPFTSIIEQTADEYRKALGPLATLGLVEHHSNLNPTVDTRANKLSAENWDAPLIVTTNVQLYESLFAAKTTPCRKLHRLANSVIVLDEAQTIPVDLLAPTLAALRELVARYGCTVVLCTATQPALEKRKDEFEIGLTDVRPIIEDVDALHRQLKRVQVQRLGMLTDEQLVDRLAAEQTALCVVNTRAHAASLFDGLSARARTAGECFHLSTFMCAQHRRDVLDGVRRRLGYGLACRLVSTQLIEAGVDVDFPATYRAPAGFDSIAQSAGRCNREGRLQDSGGNPVLGRVYTFETDPPPPKGQLRQTAEKAKELFDLHPDPLAPSAVEAYFRLFYWSREHAWDKHDVLPCFGYPSGKGLAPFQYRRAADAYRIIREEQTPVVVPYTPAGRAMRDAVLAGRPVDFRFLRDAQRYTVSLRKPLLDKLSESGTVVPDADGSGLWALANDAAYYSADKGLSPGIEGMGVEWQIF